MTRGFGRFLRRNTIALLALFVALGGTTYAASTGLIGKNTVASPQVVNGSLQTKDLSKKARKALKGNRGLRGLRGPKGATGATGATGAQGPQGVKGDIGPSETRQNFVVGNLALSNSAASKTTITTLTLPGPADYLINATGMVFSSVSGDKAGIELARDGAAVGSYFNEVGLPTGNVAENYAVNRLVHVAGASSVVVIRGWRHSGTGSLMVFTNTLTATRVGSAFGAQSVASKSTGSVGTNR
jgi:hypothetical protein